jgi:hypothetical protein
LGGPEAHIARAQFYLSRILRGKGNVAEASEMETRAQQVRQKALKEHGDILSEIPGDEAAIFDQMATIPIPRLRLKSLSQERFQDEDEKLDFGVGYMTRPAATLSPSV